MTNATAAEEWKPVVGFAGYEVSNCGRVRSLAIKTPCCVRRRTGRVLVLCVDSYGYQRVCLTRWGRAFSRTVHKLVLEAFVGRSANLQCNHIDCDKTNNHLGNLEWVTASENIQHALANGLLAPLKGEQVSLAKLTESDVVAIRHEYEAGGITQARLADRYGVTGAAIFYVVRRKTWKHVGERK